MDENCKRISRKLSTLIEEVASLNQTFYLLGLIDHDVWEERGSWITLRELVNNKIASKRKEIEELFQELPKACKAI